MLVGKILILTIIISITIKLNANQFGLKRDRIKPLVILLITNIFHI